MSAADPGTSNGLIAQRLAEWATELTLSDIPDAARHEAKRGILDVIGVTFAGANHPTAAMARDQVGTQYRDGPCVVLGSELSVAMTGAAFANGVAAHAWDYDDVSLEGMVHGTAAVWPAVFAVAQARDISGGDLLTAFVAGVEAEYALGRAFTPDLFFRGWWTTGLLGAIGAAIGAGRAMGLDAGTLAHAITIAVAQTTGPYALVGTPIKPYACGRAAEAGVQAASFAAAGLTGPADAFENEHGFTAMYANNVFLPEELAKIGTRYVLEASGLTFKRYPVCAGAQGAVGAVLTAMAEHRITPEQVTHVRCEVTPAINHYMQYRVPHDITEAQFSLPYCVACAVRFGDISFDHLTDAAIKDPATLAVLANVEVVASEKLAEEEQVRDDYVEPAVAILTTADGRVLRSLNPAPVGTPQCPIGDRELEGKFRACTAPALQDGDADGVIARIWSLEEQHSALALLQPTR